MKHFQAALAIFATSANALHLDADPNLGLAGRDLTANMDNEALANTNTDAAAQVHAQVSATDSTTDRIDDLEEQAEHFEKVLNFFGDTCV